jgi:predicted nuclease of restriction endonuclease-like (RecB) superfamily
MGNKQGNQSKPMDDAIAKQSDVLVAELRKLIENARAAVVSTVNAGLTLLYWRVGKRVKDEIVGDRRAEYGKQILQTLAAQLSADYGTGFAEKNLRRMIQFADIYPDMEIVVTLSRQLSWSHFLTLIPLDKPLQREFYAEMCRVERWSVRTLRKKIDSMLYERTALSKKSDELIQHELQRLRDEDRLSPQLVLKDPYFLDFLGLKDRYYEKDLEDAILRDLEAFLLELGNGFAFLARQKRIQIDTDDYYIDLLFYHRGLNRLIAIDLKLGDFKAEYKGQMELYLRWLDKHERRPQEETPLGIILCAEKKQELVELMELGQSGIHIAEYLTELPPRKLLKEKLHNAIRNAQARVKALPEASNEEC